MKTAETLAVIGAVMIVLGFAAAARGDESSAPEAMRFELTEDGKGVLVGLDLLAGRGVDLQPQQTWRSAVAEHVGSNWGKYALGILGVFAVDRAAYNNDWLWYHSRRGGDGDIKADAATVEQEATGSQVVQIYVSINGDGNTVTTSTRRNDME